MKTNSSPSNAGRINVGHAIIIFTVVILILGFSVYIFIKSTPKSLNNLPSYSDTQSIDYINALLTQQSNTISWFSVIATMILASMSAIAVIGYFNTKSVIDREQELYSLKIKLTDASEKIECVTNFWTHIEILKAKNNQIDIPLVLTNPTQKERENISKTYYNILFLQNAGIQPSENGNLTLILEQYYNGNFENIVNEQYI